MGSGALPTPANCGALGCEYTYCLPHYPHFNDDFEQRAESISNTVMNILSLISLLVEGAREILPFVRLFAFLIEQEWDTIKAQDHGKGVICVATW